MANATARCSLDCWHLALYCCTRRGVPKAPLESSVRSVRCLTLATVNLLRQSTPTMSSRWKRCCCHWVGLFHVFFWHRCFCIMMFASRIPETHQLIGFRHDPVCQAVHAALPHGVDVRRHFGNLAVGAVAELKTLFQIHVAHDSLNMFKPSPVHDSSRPQAWGQTLRHRDDLGFETWLEHHAKTCQDKLVIVHIWVISEYIFCIFPARSSSTKDLKEWLPLPFGKFYHETCNQVHPRRELRAPGTWTRCWATVAFAVYVCLMFKGEWMITTMLSGVHVTSV